MKITKQSRKLMARIVRKAFDQEISEEKAKKIVDLAFDLQLPNAEIMKYDHEQFPYNHF